MAPQCFPEEVDVFSIPHSRMKELVNKYLEMVTETNFDDAFRMTSLLENLNMTFKEFKAHEQIENRMIMRKLKKKLRALSITNTAVCNCHKDNQLTEMMSLFRDGYKCTRKTAADRINYGLKLRQALEHFTEQFIPHMKEEEEVFQPLLMKYFTYEELRELKRLVLEEHWRTVAEEGEAKLVEDSLSGESSCEEEESSHKGHYSPFDLMPDELFLKILSYLNPKELGSCGIVGKRWSQLTTDSNLWAHLFPVLWAKGDWTFSPDLNKSDEPLSEKEFMNAGLDEDADIDESLENDDSESDNFFQQLKKEANLLAGFTKHLLPKVGPGVRTLTLANSVGLTNGMLYKMLSLCPDVEVLDVSHTRISDLAFKGLGRNGCGSKLHHVDLSGCEKITDLTLQRLSQGLRRSRVTLNKNCPTSSSDNEVGKIQTLDSRNSAKTLSNGTCVRTTSLENLTQESLHVPVDKDQSDCIVQSQLFPQCDNSPLKGGLISDMQDLEISLADMVYCACPFARLTMETNAFSPPVHNCAMDSDRRGAMGCDIREVTAPVCDNIPLLSPCLEFISLSGCWLVTDDGLRALAQHNGLPKLASLDLSGCLSITAKGLSDLVEACPSLDHANLFYCDNLNDDPYPQTASGCQNLACTNRVCCRTGN